MGDKDAHTLCTGEHEHEMPDPTMAECCRKDALREAEIERLKAELRAVDPSMSRLDIRSEVLGNVPAALAPPKAENEDLLLDDIDDDDDVLIRLRDKRMNELRSKMKGGSNVVNLKLGHVETIGAASLLGITQRSKEPCVVHLHHPASMGSDHAGYLFNELSYQYKETRFLRLDIDQDLDKTVLGQPASPGIMCFIKGTLVDQAPLHIFIDSGSFLEEKVVSYLKSLNALHKCTELTDKTETSDSENEDPWLEEPCATCGRCYPHKHFPPCALEYGSEEESRSASDSD